MAGGRPTNYTPELGALIADLIKMGKTIGEICSLDSMPCTTTYYEWQAKHTEFTDKCNVAEKESADALYQDGLRELTDLPKVRAWQDQAGNMYSDEEYKELTFDERKVLSLDKVGLSSELVARGKAIYEAKKHFAAIRNPEKYSEKRQLKIENTSTVKLWLDGLDDE